MIHTFIFSLWKPHPKFCHDLLQHRGKHGKHWKSKRLHEQQKTLFGSLWVWLSLSKQKVFTVLNRGSNWTYPSSDSSHWDLFILGECVRNLSEDSEPQTQYPSHIPQGSPANHSSNLMKNLPQFIPKGNFIAHKFHNRLITFTFF